MNEYEKALMQLTSTSNFASIWNQFIENTNQPIFIHEDELEFQGLTKIGDENVDSIIMNYRDYELVISLVKGSIDEFKVKIKAFDQKESKMNQRVVLHIVLVLEVESNCIN